jgi:Chitin binding Peritrophin-A domain
VIKCLVLVSAQLSSFSQRASVCVGRMDGIVFPDSENCDAFIQCQRGSEIRQRCQTGTSFDLNLYYCVPRHAVNCGQRRQLNLPVLPPNQGENPPTSESFHSVS